MRCLELFNSLCWLGREIVLQSKSMIDRGYVIVKVWVWTISPLLVSWWTFGRIVGSWVFNVIKQLIHWWDHNLIALLEDDRNRKYGLVEGIWLWGCDTGDSIWFPVRSSGRSSCSICFLVATERVTFLYHSLPPWSLWFSMVLKATAPVKHVLKLLWKSRTFLLKTDFPNILL